MPLLSVRDLVVRFRTEEATIYAVNGVSFDLERGETMGLVGESGCGKSVTSLALTRLLPVPAATIEGGEVEFDGRSLLTMSDGQLRHIRGREIAMIFQDPLTSLNPVLSIGLQLTEGILAHEALAPREAHIRAAELLGMVGIPDAERRLRSFPHQLSGGMRQRAMIAMALALRPKLLIADEPTTALDVTIQAQVIDLLRALATRTGAAVLLITHDLGVVADMTQRTAVMYAGSIVETASTAELFAAPRHPYTVGLLHSVARIDVDDQGPVRAIEGQPPDGTRRASGCPFAPRCAWRLPVCWTVDPPLTSEHPELPVVTTGASPTHRYACHHPATVDEALAGQPLDPDFRPAPRPSVAAPVAAGAGAGA